METAELANLVECIENSGVNVPPQSTLDVYSKINYSLAKILAGDYIRQQNCIYLENELSLFDTLTGLGSRRKLESDLTTAIETSNRSGKDLSLLLLDIDNFKDVNDTYGHSKGDDVLKGLSSTINSVLRGNDLSYRSGGEEFVVLLSETSLNQGEFVAERLRREIAKHLISDLPITVSIGVSNYRGTATNSEELLAIADEGLYEAKKSGKNCVRVVSKYSTFAA